MDTISLEICWEVAKSTDSLSACPEPRSAHTLIPLVASNGFNGELVLFGGEAPASDENSTARRLGDTWILDIVTSTWKLKECSAVWGENVPTPRSNHAACIWGSYLLIFGGWQRNGLEALAELEILHLETWCWTHGSTIGSPPSPRGNPTMVTVDDQAIVFGGWNGKTRFNDVFKLDLRAWTWSQPTSEHVAQELVPYPRTDHSAVVWSDSDTPDKSCMVVFGGSSSEGLLNDVWKLDLHTWSWSKVEAAGTPPAPRSSHAAAHIGYGRMLITGGSVSGVSLASHTLDAFILDLNSNTWLQFQQPGSNPLAAPHLTPLCRHTLTALPCSSWVVWGGYNGSEEQGSLLVGSLRTADSDGRDKSASFNAITPKQEGSSQRPTRSNNKDKDSSLPVSQQVRWDSKRPLRAEDLGPEVAGLSARQLARALHKKALEIGAETYIDPPTGYSVFTEVYLKTRQCCGNKCRHCPYGHVNVPKKKANLDW